MATAYQIAISMVNRSIELAREKGKGYYLNHIKLQKLMYLGQCYSLAKYGRELFVDNIRRHDCGPYIESLDLFVSEQGFGEYTSPIRGELSGTAQERDAINTVLRKYGHGSAAQLVAFTKGSDPYKSTKRYRELVSKDEMKKYGRKLFAVQPVAYTPSVEGYLELLQKTEEGLRDSSNRWKQRRAAATYRVAHR